MWKSAKKKLKMRSDFIYEWYLQRRLRSGFPDPEDEEAMKDLEVPEEGENLKKPLSRKAPKKAERENPRRPRLPRDNLQPRSRVRLRSLNQTSRLPNPMRKLKRH